MISLDRLKAIEHIITHEHCPDGVASALVLKWCFPKADLSFVQHNTKDHRELRAKPGLIFSDFSPHKDRVQEFVEAEAIVLDHHHTQKDIVGLFGDLGVYGDAPGVSGAVLAYQEVYRPLVESGALPVGLQEEKGLVEDLVSLIGIRDTWMKSSPRWREANECSAALMFWPIENLLGKTPSEVMADMKLGPILYQKRLDQAHKRVDQSYRITSQAGTRVIVFDGVIHTSDASDHAGTSVDLVAGFNLFVEDGEPVIVVSLRSGSDFDCSAMARHYGGGGHLKAAGFKRTLQPQDPHPFTLVEQLVEQYEQQSQATSST